MNNIKGKIASFLFFVLVALLALAPAAQAMYAKYPGEAIKSIQHITASISHAAGTYTSDTSTITAVDTTKTLVFVKSVTGNLTAPYPSAISAYISSSTQVVYPVTVTGTGTYSTTVAADVVEFAAPFKSIQWVHGGSATQTITSVNINKTVVLSTNMAYSANTANATATLQDATTVAFSGTGTASHYWAVIEFY